MVYLLIFLCFIVFIISRSIDVIFNSVAGLQTSKYQLKPDKLNGFEILNECEAELERLQELNMNRTPIRRKKACCEEKNLTKRNIDTQKVPVDEDQQYSIFVSYVEIYNNYTYDLLDQPKLDIGTGKQKLASKILREDR